MRITRTGWCISCSGSSLVIPIAPSVHARGEIVRHEPAGRDLGGGLRREPRDREQPGLPRHVALRWAQGLKRVFGIQIEACARCGARLKILASIEEPGVTARILAHRDWVSGRLDRLIQGS